VPSLILLRGLPGSGKSTFADCVIGGPVVSADDFMVDELHNYQFNPARLPEVHQKCLEEAGTLLREYGSVIVANTFSMRWEMEPYIDLAELVGARYFVVDLFNNGLSTRALAEANTHGVPEETITNMEARWEHNWRDGNPDRPVVRPPT